MELKVGIFVILCTLWHGLVFAKTSHKTAEEVKLKPRIRIEAITDSKTVIPGASLRLLLESSLILDNKQQFSYSPCIVAEQTGHVQGGPGNIIYVKGITNAEESQYTIYRAGESYTHPITGEMLGFEALAVGSAEVKTLGDPAIFEIKTAKESIETGDRLYPTFVAELPKQLTLSPAATIPEAGYILSVRDGVTQVGPNQIVLISLGEREGIEEGNVLDIYETGKTVVDPHSKGWRKKQIPLPDVRIGKLVVFQVYEKLSLALVLEAREIIHLLDKVKSP